MKKKLSIIAVFLVAAAALSAGYYTYKKTAAPPQIPTFAGPEELKSEILRLEGEKTLSWQDAFRLGVYYLHAGRLDDAVKTLEDVAQRRPLFDRARESLGMAYYRKGRYEKSAEEWKKSLELNPSAEHLKDMIARAERFSAMEKRISTLEEEVKKTPSWQERFELAALYIGVNRPDAAIRELEKALGEQPDSPEVYDALAEAYARKGDFKKAVAMGKKALELRPADEWLKRRLAELEKLKETKQGR